MIISHHNILILNAEQSEADLLIDKSSDISLKTYVRALKRLVLTVVLHINYIVYNYNVCVFVIAKSQGMDLKKISVDSSY